jgi:AAA+ ATPase superfamily predicted ATPase
MNERVIPHLLDLGLLRKRFPITDDAQRSRRSVYTISDPHFAFYFQFVSPNRGPIDRGFGRQVVDDIILPRLEGYIGGVFEDIAREYVHTLIQQDELHGVDVGSWWSTNGKHEIDIVGVGSGRRPTFAGSVKWRDAELGDGVLRDLNESIAALGATEPIPRILIGRHGATAALRKAGIHSAALDDLYRSAR